MAQIVLTFPDAIALRVLAALSALYGYETQIEAPLGSGTRVANPETRAAFVKRRLALELKAKVVAYEAFAAARQAEASAGATAETEISVT